MGAAKKQCWKSSEDWNEWDGVRLSDEGISRIIHHSPITRESVLTIGYVGYYNDEDNSITPYPQHRENVKKFIAKCRLMHPDFPYWVKEEEGGKESN